MARVQSVEIPKHSSSQKYLMKTCTKCNKVFSESEFYWKNKPKGIRATQCKYCQKLYRDKHYQQNREKRIKQSTIRTLKIRAVNEQNLYQYLLKNPCIDCGEPDPIVLDFDHRRDKRDGICNMVRNGYSWNTISKEISKCDVRCSNCHRRKTAKERGYYKLSLQESGANGRNRTP